MNLQKLIKWCIRRIGDGLGIVALQDQINEVKLLAAGALIRHMKGRDALGSINEAEFKVFSQFGDDGIIQYLVHCLRISARQQVFIEFGVENYEEANTKFLLLNDNWRGLVLDGSSTNIDAVTRDGYYWRYDLTAAAAFVDRDNVNDLFRKYGFQGEIGLLSIDIDGNDYWIWERIEAVDPIIVIVEYNSVFGSQHAVTIPYEPAFHRSKAHYSNLYWGASLKALWLLSQNKGYAFVGCNSAGNNAYFVRRDRMGVLKPLTVEEGYVESRFRESRDLSGRLSYLQGGQRLRAIAGMVVFDVEHGRELSIDELYRVRDSF
jgi:hypothetical protein